jgi:toxin CcdB
MPQFDVYQNPNTATKNRFPLLLEVQSDLLSELQSCVVIPLCDARQYKDALIERLLPRIPVNARDYVLMTPQLAGISRKALGKQVANIAACRGEVLAALDFLIVGY